MKKKTYNIRTPQQWRDLLTEYRATPMDERRAWLKKHRVATSVLYRHKRRLGIDTTYTPDTLPVPRAEKKARTKRNGSPALIADLMAENTLLKGLLQIAYRGGFLDSFLTFNNITTEEEI